MTITAISALSLSIWIYLLMSRHDFWRCSQTLNHPPPPTPEVWPEVVAILPARNEAETIGAVISSHAETNYAGKFSTILVDDQSDDNTAELASAAAGEHQLEIIKGVSLPEDWTGKVWAMEQGLRAARESFPQAEWILFTDADIRLDRDALARLISKAEHGGYALVSLMARLDMSGKWGALLMPAFVYFFQKLYPFPAVNDPDEDIAGAAGGILLIRRDAVDRTGCMAKMRNTMIDDCTIARAVKDLPSDNRLWLGLARDEAVSLRDNSGFASIWQMVTRTAYAQLNFSVITLAVSVSGMVITYLIPPLIILTAPHHGSFLAVAFSLLAFGLMLKTYRPTIEFYEAPKWSLFSLPFAAAIFLAMTVGSALSYWRGAGGLWKGRVHTRH